MKTIKLVADLAAVGIIITLLLGNTCMFVVHERDQIVVTRLNKPVHVIVGNRTPEQFEVLKSEILLAARRTGEGADKLRISMGAGLYFKAPFTDTVERFPDVLMTYDVEEEAVVLPIEIRILDALDEVVELWALEPAGNALPVLHANHHSAGFQTGL